ncbi:MAG: hypothetical protein HGA16_01795 [Candidatus Moranbacteria bacterium]|nr:hypothetical protein [Candidatus Moranbacteria bacterium]
MMLLYALILYVLFLKALPFVLYPNYMLPGKVERYPALVELSEKLRGKDRKETLGNAFAYLRKHHKSDDRIWIGKNLLTLLRVGDFSTKSYLARTVSCGAIPWPYMKSHREYYGEIGTCLPAEIRKFRLQTLQVSSGYDSSPPSTFSVFARNFRISSRHVISCKA